MHPAGLIAAGLCRELCADILSLIRPHITDPRYQLLFCCAWMTAYASATTRALSNTVATRRPRWVSRSVGGGTQPSGRLCSLHPESRSQYLSQNKSLNDGCVFFPLQFLPNYSPKVGFW